MRRRTRAASGGVAAGVLAAAALLGGGSTWAALRGSTASAGNSLTGGNVVLADDDGAARLFDLTGLTPASPAEHRCIDVTYGGSLPARVRLYATSAGGLAPYLRVKITRGTLASPSFPSCASFAADATDHRGLGAGVLYDGRLADLPADFGSGIEDPSASSPATWTTGTRHAYRFTVTVAADAAAMSTSATASFAWEAHSQ